MSVYVDDAHIPAAVTDRRTGRTYRARWSHLTADTKTELHTFAARIGLSRAWFQDKPGGLWHYDVTANKRRQAIAAGAVEISWRDREVWFRHGREGLQPSGPQPDGSGDGPSPSNETASTDPPS
jgi:hypothetical protein